MSDQFHIIERVALLDEYRYLCTAVGWADVINFEAARDALAYSLYGVIAMCDGRTVGMGRIVGDGAISFYIQDIAVLPEYQGRGISKAILAQLMTYIEYNAPEKAFVALFAAEGTLPFYTQYGFETHPGLTGIFQVMPEGDRLIGPSGTLPPDWATFPATASQRGAQNRATTASDNGRLRLDGDSSTTRHH